MLRSRWGTRRRRPGTRPTRPRPTRCASPWPWCTRRRWRRRVTGPGRWPRWTVCGPGCATSWASTRRRSRRGCGRRCSGTRCPERPGGPVRRSREAAPERTFDGLAFVGRDMELARLRAAIGAREVVALGGVAGAGKSRLVAEATRDVALPVLTCRAFLPERGEAWGLARSVLREALALDAHLADRLAPRVRAALAVLLPEIDGIDVPLDGEARRALVLAGGVELLAAAVRDGAVLVVDDLQWADPSSLTFLASALARLPRLAAVLAFRPDEPALDLPADDVRSTDPAPSTTSALAAVRASRGVVDVTLGALPDDGLDALVGDPRLAAALRAETDRTPFAVAEVLRELAVRGVAVAGPDGRWLPRDAGAVALAGEVGRQGQRRAVRRRAERETGARAQVLALVALLARETTARIVATAAGLDPRAALDALSGLATAGLLRLGEQGWATAHDLVGETVTAALAPGERGRLHGLLAAALEADDADPAEVARHHRDAGDGTAAAAAFERAARRALAGYATREAAAHAEAGLAVETPARPARRPGRGAGRARRRRRSPRRPAGGLDRRRRARAVTAAVPVGDADHGRPRSGARRRAGRAGAGRGRRRRGRAGRRAGDRGDPRREPRPRGPRRGAGRRRARAVPRPRRRSGRRPDPGRPRDGGLPRRADHRGGRVVRAHRDPVRGLRRPPARRHAPLDPRARPGLPRRARGGAGGDVGGGAARAGSRRAGRAGVRAVAPVGGAVGSRAARRGRGRRPRGARRRRRRSGTAGGPRPPGARSASRCRSSSGSTRPPRRSGSPRRPRERR